ncbi:MAG: insulinase family protein [Rhodobacteraceae bacterium]|nr:insulinase family protein [Paracoccaceae bacterium]
MSIQLHTLPNGMRVVTEHMPGLQSASIGVWVSAGGRHETVQQNGIAHFLEHMAFKGTTTRSALQIAEQIEDVGGYINAYTSRETTAYYVRVLNNDVPLAVDILSDILRNSVFDPREIEVERGVILQEIGQTLDTPDDIIFDWLQETAYPDQSIGRSILGPADNIKRFDRDDLTSFVSAQYQPQRMILAAAGGIDHDALLSLVTQAFQDLSPDVTPQLETIAKFSRGEYRNEKTLEQAHFALAFESPSYKSDDIYTAQVYSITLGGGMSSRLFQEAREKRGLCYSIFAQTGAYVDTGMTTIYAGTAGDQIAGLSRLTIDEFKRAADDMTQAEVDRARAQMKAGMLMGLESASNRAERLARMVQVWGYVPDLSEAVEKIDAVDLTSVKAYAEQVATTAKMASAIYGPISSAPTLDELENQRAA